VAWTSSYSPSFAQPLLNTSSDTRKAVLGTDATNLPLDHCASWECGNLEVSYLLTSRALGFARAARIPTSRRLYVPGIAKADLPRALSRVPAGETTLLLAHEPDYADFVAKFSVDLQLSGHFQNNRGIRIDHFLLSPALADRLEGCEIDKGPRGQEEPSDHTPIIVTLSDPP
jgi:hypothetical protein